jgi:hypothetical protein
MIYRLLMVIILGVGAVLIGGVAWGVVGYFLNKIYFWLAIVIGFMVTIALLSPYERTTLPLAVIMFPLAICLGLITVFWGDFVYLVLVSMREFQIGFGEAIQGVASQFMALELASGGQASLLCAALGTVFSFIYLAREPKRPQ